MIPIVGTLLAGLAERGLGLLRDAILAKGKEKVEELIGTKIPDTAAGLTPEKTAELQIAMMEHEERLLELTIEREAQNLEAEKAASEQVTSRWSADMNSDSWLSKNIRPLTLIFLLGTYVIFALLSAFGVAVNEAYVKLLGEWGMMVMSAYFVGRTIEKGIEVFQKHKTLREAPNE